MTRRIYKSKGFSLVEMLTALTIFGLGVLGTMEVFAVSLRSTSASLGYTHASLLAQQMMEDTIAEGDLMPWEDSGDFGADHPGHSWILEINETEDIDLYEIEVVVTWSDRGRDKEYTLTTLVAERQSSFAATEVEEGGSR